MCCIPRLVLHTIVVLHSKVVQHAMARTAYRSRTAYRGVYCMPKRACKVNGQGVRTSGRPRMPLPMIPAKEHDLDKLSSKPHAMDTGPFAVNHNCEGCQRAAEARTLGWPHGHVIWACLNDLKVAYSDRPSWDDSSTTGNRKKDTVLSRTTVWPHLLDPQCDTWRTSRMATKVHIAPKQQHRKATLAG